MARKPITNITCDGCGFRPSAKWIKYRGWKDKIRISLCNQCAKHSKGANNG